MARDELLSAAVKADASSVKDVEEVITITAKSGKVTIQHNSIGAKRTYDLDRWTPAAMLANFIEDELVLESTNFKSEVVE